MLHADIYSYQNPLHCWGQIVQAGCQWLCPCLQVKRGRPLKKNPLKNLGALLKLNPYAKTARRQELLYQVCTLPFSEDTHSSVALLSTFMHHFLGLTAWILARHSVYIAQKLSQAIVACLATYFTPVSRCVAVACRFAML